MSVVVITGSAGLIGSEAAEFYAGLGYEVIGIDNNMREQFFGPEGSTQSRRQQLQSRLGKRYHHEVIDIRDSETVDKLFARYRDHISLIVHTAAQPSHDWAAKAPTIDFTVNANGTLNLLEAMRHHSPEAVFVFTSTNKVYGDAPNRLPIVEQETRWEIDPSHNFASGITEEMPVDQCMHSLFGVSKLSADLLVQEYGRYFQFKTACFRGGVLSGSRQSGVQLHGFINYLMRCAMTGQPYQIFGYQGKQVRDVIHSRDVIAAFHAFFESPRSGGEVYNLGGGRDSNISVLEAIELAEEITHTKLERSYASTARMGDHIWYVTDMKKFCSHYPQWKRTHNVRSIMEEIFDARQLEWRA